MTFSGVSKSYVAAFELSSDGRINGLLTLDCEMSPFEGAAILKAPGSALIITHKLLVLSHDQKHVGDVG